MELFCLHLQQCFLFNENYFDLELSLVETVGIAEELQYYLASQPLLRLESDLFISELGDGGCAVVVNAVLHCTHCVLSQSRCTFKC